MAQVDWSATPDDPHGYEKLRSAVDSFALQLDELGWGQRAARHRSAQGYLGGTTTEWMGETALALNDVLANGELPDGLPENMENTVEAIRTGFRRCGDQPPF